MGKEDQGAVTEMPGPKLLETNWGVQARQFLSDLLGSQPQVPMQQTAGMTDLEELGQSQLADLVRGGTFEDPRESGLYAGLRKEAGILRDEGLSSLKRRANTSGMFNSSQAMGREGDFLARSNASQLSLLGGLYNQERNRDNPYTRLGALQQFGGLPRNVANQRNQAAFNQQMGQFEAPYRYQAPIAQRLLDYQPWYQPQYIQGEEGDSASKWASASQGAQAGGAVGGPWGAVIGGAAGYFA